MSTFTNAGPSTTTGTNTIGGGSPATIGSAATSLVGFYGATPVAQQAFIATQSINALSVSGVVGFSSSTSLSAVIEKLNAIEAVLVVMGLIAAS